MKNNCIKFNIINFLVYSVSFVIFCIPFHSTEILADPNSEKEELKKIGINLTYEDFFLQISKGNLKTVSLFLDAGFNVNHENKELESPIKIATKKGHIGIMKFLLSKGAFVNTGDYTPLMIAADEGNTDAAATLLKYGLEVDVNDTGIQNEIALHHACRNSQYKIAETLINSGSDLNWFSDHGISPLISAVMENDKQMVQLLLKNGADVDAGDLREGYFGQTPLMYAASYGYKDMADLLLRNGSKINKKDKNGETALNYAIRNKGKKIISFFEKEGAKEGTAQNKVERLNKYGGATLKITASSCLPAHKGIGYNAEQIYDFNASTSWVEGVKDYGIGEYIEFVYDFSKVAKTDYSINTIIIYNGYCKNFAIWKSNSRVKRVKIYVNTVPHTVITLKDTNDMQTVSMPSIKFVAKKINIVRFEILDVYKGAKYKDTAISELQLMSVE